MIANDVNRASYKPFYILLGIHEQERVRSLCLHKHIDIAAFMILATGNRPKKPERLDAIVLSKRAAITLQNVYIICPAHALFFISRRKYKVFS